MVHSWERNILDETRCANGTSTTDRWEYTRTNSPILTVNFRIFCELGRNMSFTEFLVSNFNEFLTYTGFANATGGNLIMIVVGAILIYLAIKKD